MRSALEESILHLRRQRDEAERGSISNQGHDVPTSGLSNRMWGDCELRQQKPPTFQTYVA